MISVLCSCGRKFKADDQHAGKRTRCPVCGNMLVIGQTAGKGPSNISDNGEMPSWWFPSGSPARQTHRFHRLQPGAAAIPMTSRRRSFPPDSELSSGKSVAGIGRVTATRERTKIWSG